MNIRRQYSLPNCILILEGLDTTGESGAARPCLSVLLQVKCQFPMAGKTFECDREFFETFAQTVSLYGQQVISGVRSPDLAEAPDLLGLLDDPDQVEEDELDGDGGGIAVQAPAKAEPDHPVDKPVIDPRLGPIQIYPIGPSLHRLWIQPPPMVEGEAAPEPLDLEISTLQLFDVVEVVDQFYADNRTLPDVTQALASVSRRYLASREPLAQRILPGAIGATTLAAAAGVMFLFPHPETVERPEDVYRDAEELNQPALPVPGAGTPPQGNPESSPTLTPLEAPTSESPEGNKEGDREETSNGEEGSTSGETDQSSRPRRRETTQASRPAPKGTAPKAIAPSPAVNPSQVSGLSGEAEILDPTVLRSLNATLRDSIDEAWTDRKPVKQDLEYRVGVSADGKVVGYRPVNESAKAFGSDRLPLQKILFNPVEAQAAGPKPSEPLAVFKVVLTDEGIPQVSPLRGYSAAPSSQSTLKHSAPTNGSTNASTNGSINESAGTEE